MTKYSIYVPMVSTHGGGNDMVMLSYEPVDDVDLAYWETVDVSIDACDRTEVEQFMMFLGRDDKCDRRPDGEGDMLGSSSNRYPGT